VDPEDDTGRPLGRLVGALTAHADVASLTAVLTGTLADLLPGDLVRVERDRSLADRLHGRPGRPVGITVPAGDHELTLRTVGHRTEAEIAHTVRGVTLSRRPVPITEWIEQLAAALDAQAAHDDAARAALDRLLLG
jgi:hypothetical protein